MTTCFAFAEECAVETETKMPRPLGAPNTSPKTISIESQSQSQSLSDSRSLSQSSQVFSRVSCLASSWKCGYFMGLQMAINLYSFYAESVSYSVNLLVNFHSQFFLTPHPPAVHAHSHLFILVLTFRLTFSKFGRQQTLLWTLYEFLCFFSRTERVSGVCLWFPLCVN